MIRFVTRSMCDISDEMKINLTVGTTVVGKTQNIWKTHLAIPTVYLLFGKHIWPFLQSIYSFDFQLFIFLTSTVYYFHFSCLFIYLSVL